MLYLKSLLSIVSRMTACSFSTTSTRRQRPSTKPSAIRMRRLLDRRRRGFRCISFEFCAADVDGLVRAGFLDRKHRNDHAAVERAIAAMLERL